MSLPNAIRLLLRYENRKIGDVVYIALLLSITLFIYSFLLRLPLPSIIGDAQRYHGYYLYIMRYSLEKFGQFALWDQLFSSGTSWISNPGGPYLLPSAWAIITFFDDIMIGSRIFFLFHTLTASIAMYFFLRVLNLQKFTSFLIAILAVCNYYIALLVRNGWFEEFFGFTIIPLTTGLLWLALTKRSFVYSVLAAIAMSFNFFGNTFYVFHYNVIALLIISFGLFVNVLWNNRKKNKVLVIRNLALNIAFNLVFWLVFIGVSSIKLFPLLEFRSLSSRSVLPLTSIETPDGVMSFSFFHSLFRNFIIPAGHTNSFTHWTNDLALFFIFLAILYFLIKRSFTYGLFLSLLIIGMWGYFANRIPIDLYAILYQYLPGFNSNNYPYRFIIVIYFAFLVCIGLGLEVLIRRKNRILFLLGILLGTILVIGALWYTTVSYSELSYPQSVDIKNDLRRSILTVEKDVDMTQPPKIKGEFSKNLVTDLIKIVKAYPFEGRVYSTSVFSHSNLLQNNIILEQEIPTIHHFYDPIVPTYQYAIIPAGSTQDSLELTRKRFKIFSILNARFHLQEKEPFEYEGCNKLALPKNNTENSTSEETKRQAEDVCSYLEARISPLVTKREGGIYYDTHVLPRVVVIRYPVLLISDNRFTDYSGFIAKQLVFHPDFDEHYTSILSGGSTYIDDYSLDTLKRFSAILLVEHNVKDRKRTEKMLSQYKQQGGRVIKLTSKWINYESLHDRSTSLWTDKQAWEYSQEDQEALSVLFQSFKSDIPSGKIEIQKFTPEDLIFKVNTKKKNTVLQYSDSFYPGWKAEIDSLPATVYMADGLVKGVVISQKGSHTIRMYYSPESFKIGAAITVLTISSLLTLGIYKGKKNMKEKLKKSLL